MYSKNNKYMQEQKSANRAQRFSLRKLSIGTVSVLLGTLMFFSNGQVSADTTTGTDTSADAASVNSAANDTSASTVTLSSANSAAASDANSSAATSSAAASAQTATAASASADSQSAAATSTADSSQAASTASSASAATTAASDDALSSKGEIVATDKISNSDVTPGMSNPNGASVVADESKIPSGYKADPTDGRYTFGIVSLGPTAATDGTTTYNGENNTNYYFRFSTGKAATNGQYDDTVYAQLVDGDTGQVIWQGTLTVNGAAVQVDKLKNVISDGSTHYYQLTYTATTNNGVTTKQINVNSDVGTQLSKVIYDAGNRTNTSAGTVVHVMYPDESTIRTEYIAKDAAGNETVLANYEQTGRQGYTYTASGARIFKGFDLISSPSNTTGTLSASYKVGGIIVSTQKQLSDQLQIARIYVITETNGTARVVLKVAAVGASIDDIDNENIWKTILTTDPVAPGEFADNGNYDAGTHKNGAFLLYTLPQDGKLPIGVKYLTNAGFTEDQLTGYEKYLTIYGLNNRLAVGQEPVKYYYAPQGQVRINYVTSDGTVIQTPTTAYENSGNNTSYDVTGSTYRPETITVNGKTYRYVKSDKSMGTAGTTTVNGFTYNTTPSDATGTISSNNVNDVYYVYEQVTYHTEAETKDVTRTIEYYDSVTGEPIPSNLESTVTQTATLTRNKIYDDQNNFIGYGTVSADGSSYTIDDSWKVDAQTWTQQDSADLSDYGYTAPDRASVAAVTVDGNTTNVTEKVYYGHQTMPVTPTDPKTPGEPINPNDPNSPVYPTETNRDNLVKDATQTIHYVGAGDKTPGDNVVTQKDAFTRTVTIDKVTGKVLSTSDWEGTKTFNTVDTPVVQGYHADKKTAGGLTATPDNPDVEETVTYAPNGKIVPVDPNGTPIPGADTPTYPTDPNDPTKVVPNEPIPDVPGYTPVDPSPVTPADPGKDTPVPYVQVVTGTIKYIDDTTGKTLSSSDLPSGKVGSTINYTTADKIKTYEDQGYELVSNDFTDGSQVYEKTGNDFVVHLKHKTQTITPNDPNPVTPGQPINPNDPDSPVYPTDADRNNLVKDATQTIHYVGAGDKTPADKVQTQKDAFTRTVTIDKVTGEVISMSDWEGTKTFGTENTPVIDGYYADKKAAGGLTATPDNPNVEETVTYAPNGKLIPVDPNGNPIPGADTPTYPTDPNDPTKVVPNEPIPEVPGYTPVDPSPVTPADPGKDTPVPYKQNQYGLTEKFVDEDGNELSPSVNKGSSYKSGDGFDVTGDAKVINGYVLVKQDNTKGTFGNGDETATFIYKKIGKIIPVDPNGNPIPGADTPIYQNDPNDPTKVIPNEPIPEVPGYTPVDPSPITPADPTVDTPVPYTKNETPTTPDTPSTPTTPTIPGEPTTPVTPAEPAQPQTPAAPAGQSQATPTSAKTEAAKAATLPQTGNDKNEATAAMGLGFAGIASMLALFGTRKKRRED
ncbi:MAG: YSIRK-type signal peptide-containing protein [Limosilactobacillus mucosae]|nr:YSIRK-type signal peptide-containing protein [Limosilactobacillus mucosae]MCI6051923.1 YSIRK-type signal peptide-containing protein [Limosilactobacillus mucosae]